MDRSPLVGTSHPSPPCSSSDSSLDSSRSTDSARRLAELRERMPGIVLEDGIPETDSGSETTRGTPIPPPDGILESPPEPVTPSSSVSTSLTDEIFASFGSDSSCVDPAAESGASAESSSSADELCELLTWHLPNPQGETTHKAKDGPLADFALSSAIEDEREEFTFRLPRRYHPIKIVGTGAYGKVAAAHDSVLKKTVAIKKIRAPFSRPKEFQKRVLREVLLLLHFREAGCQNIISLLDLIPPVSYRKFQDIYIVTDLMDTDLYKFLRKNPPPLDNDHVKYFTYELLKGVAETHKCGVLHRDLKPANVLISSQLDVKLCDFGLARGIDFNVEMSTHYVVTRYYRAPELLLMWDKTSTSVDVWSVGCILAEMISSTPAPRRRVLFRGNGWIDQLKRILSVVGFPNESQVFGSENAKRYISQMRAREGFRYRKQSLLDIFPDADPLCVDLVAKLLTWDPFDRLSAEQALKHPYFADLYSEECDDLHFPSETFHYRVPGDIEVREIKKKMYELIHEFSGDKRVTLDETVREVVAVAHKEN